MITGCQQCEADDAQRFSSFFAMAALRECRALVKAVDVGEKVGCIEQQFADIGLEAVQHTGDNIAFDIDQCVARDAVHIVPETLAGQLFGIDACDPCQSGCVVPMGDGIFRAWSEAAVDDSDEHVGSDRDCGTSFRDMLVEKIDEIELISDVVQSGTGAEFVYEGIFGFGWLLDRGEDIIGASEVFLPDDFWFSVDAFGLSGVVVGMSLDFFGGDAGHG